MPERKYKALIKKFLDSAISVGTFETEYLSNFKSEPAGMDEMLYRILDKLFAAVDSYWSECLPGQESAFEISEIQLRQEAKTALTEIDKYLLKKQCQRGNG